MATEVGTDKSAALPTTSRISKRGFASLDPARQKEIASLGGKASHKSGNGHQFTSEEARIAGQKSRQKKAATEVTPSVKAMMVAAKKEKKAASRQEAIKQILKEG